MVKGIWYTVNTQQILLLCYLSDGPQTSSIGISWELDKNANYWVPPHTY